jgi:hypothetical protein
MRAIVAAPPAFRWRISDVAMEERPASRRKLTRWGATGSPCLR